MEAEAAEDALLAFLKDEGYLDAKRLPDGSYACLLKLMFTVAIITGCTRHGYGNRFCFEDPTLALQRYAELQSEDDEPAGYIARR